MVQRRLQRLTYLMCFRFLQVMWRFLRTGRVPHQGHGIDYESPDEAVREAAQEKLMGAAETAPLPEAAR
jgi:hypothetical protein